MAYTVEAGGKMYPFNEHDDDNHDGYVRWSTFSWTGLNRSMDSTIYYVRGLEHQGIPPLGAGLDIGGDVRDWPHAATIWPGDIPTFLDRVKAFELLGTGFTSGENGNIRELTDDEREWCDGVLDHPDLDKETIDVALSRQSMSLGATVSRLAFISQRPDMLASLQNIFSR